MKQLDIIASVQPHFVVSDFWVEERLGKTRARWVYPFETLVKQGLTVVSGSDCPVEPISPILGVWAAVAKQRIPDENLTVEEALRTYTVNAAYASFVENEKGTIETGKCADFVILSAGILRIPREKIKEVIAEMTVVDGKIVHVSKDFQKTG
jgi:predicted amidohydrolase YtcJ